MAYKPAKALMLAFLIWLVGFIWGSVVFMVPALKAAAPIPFISSNPWVSFPILLAWIPMSYTIAVSHLRPAPDPRLEGLRLGGVFALVNLVLDLGILVIVFKAGAPYFASLTVWLGYLLLFLLPWLAGRTLEGRRPHSA
jgi:hypothetical protein